MHRLDKDTSGILVLAKERHTAKQLTELFRARQTRKRYWALVVGVPDNLIGTISTPLGKRFYQGAEKMAVVTDEADGQSALTHYRVIASTQHVSWVELYPVTGRTHQLRVHMCSIGHPVYGDGKYGGKDAFISQHSLPSQLHLHSRYLSMPLPERTIKATAPLPAHMEESWHLCGFPMEDHGVSLLEITS